MDAATGSKPIAQTRSPWYPPSPPESSREPTLRVFNSLTKEKNVFQPMQGRSVTWYNCGPTVYDSAHLGHARNYVSQDIIRRILVNYFNYDIRFVMNVTDIDDKIIIRARQNHLLSNLRSTSQSLSQDLVTQASEAWVAYFHGNFAKSFLEGDRPLSQSFDALQAEFLALQERGHKEENWWNAAKATSEKFSMHLTALITSATAILNAQKSLATGDISQEKAAELIDSAADVLSPYLDSKLKTTVTDPSISPNHAAYWEEDFANDMAKLRVMPPDTITRVTEYVPEIVEFVKRIVENGYGYVAEDGSVYFDTRAFDGNSQASQEQEEWSHFYAKLQPAKKGNKDALEEGEGALTTGATKRHPSDFALWKASKPGEPAWTSPWGPTTADGVKGGGRPGWHIECSVMASEILGQSMDIHSGGVDLQFPHHDNELAQSEAYHDCRQWVNYFLHTGHLHIEGLKMSKSLKNFITIKEALELYTPRQLRLAFLGQLWSAPMDFKEALIQEVKAREAAFDNLFTNVKALIVEARSKGYSSDGKHHYDRPEKDLVAFYSNSQHLFRQALCDSFNTPAALDVLLELVTKLNVYLSRGRSNVNVSVLEQITLWITRMLRTFGLGEGPIDSNDRTIGWGQYQSGDSSQSAAIDRETVLLPYLQVLSSFRDNVRKLAISKAQPGDILALCDKLRDIDLVPLGVALDDQEDGQALVKLVDPAILIKARDEKAAVAKAKADRKLAQQEAERQKKVARLEKGKIPPTEIFRPPNVPEDTYGSWNEETGIPLTEKDGTELSKAKAKKLQKEWDIQKKAHETYQDWVSKGRP